MSAVLHAKHCIHCLAAKPLEEFYPHPKSQDRRQGACIECVKAAVKANYRRNRDHYVKYDQLREQLAYRKLDKLEARKRYREKHPEKVRARSAVSNAIRDGRLDRQPCQKCKTTANVHAHHHDYSKPLDVEWLCKDCHWLEHGSVLKESA